MFKACSGEDPVIFDPSEPDPTPNYLFIRKNSNISESYLI